MTYLVLALAVALVALSGVVIGHEGRARWQLRQAQLDAEIGPDPPPRGFARGPTAEEQAAIDRTRARRKEVARAAAQKRETRRA